MRTRARFGVGSKAKTTMKKICLVFVGLFCFGAVAAQVPYDTVTVVDPQNFTLATTIDTALVQVISRKAGQNRRINFHTVKSYSTPDITLAWLGINIEDTTGIATTYRDFFVTDNEGEVWFVDNAGRARKLYDPAQFQDLTISDDTIYISDGNFAILPGIAGTTIDSISYYSDTLRIYEGGDTIPFKAEIVAGAGISDLNDLADVDTAGIGANDLLRWNGTDWVPVSPVQFIWEQNIPYGQGLTDRTAYYSNDTTLTYTAITYSATEWNAGALTGATGIASGTTAQRPAGVAGKMRFNSDLSDLEFHNGSAWRSLPESSANAFTAGQFIIANPAGILSDTTAAGVLSMIGGVGGTGASPQVAYWSGTSTLTGHANFLWDGSQLSVGTTNSDYTLELGTGGMRFVTQAAAPVGAAGVVYFDDDAPRTLWLHNGSAFYAVPRASIGAFTSTRIPYSDGSQLTEDAGLTYNAAGDDLTVTDDVNCTSVWTSASNNEGLNLGTASVGVFRSTASNEKINVNLHNGGNEGCITFQESGGTDRAKIGLNALNGGTVYGVFASNFGGMTNGAAVTYSSGGYVTGTNAGNATYTAGSGGEGLNAGNIVIQGGGFVSSGAVTGVTGIIEIKTVKDCDSTSYTHTLRTHMRFSGLGNRTTTQLLNRLATTTGTQVLTMESDTIKYRIENFGAISTSTDGSGDVTVTHGMGTTPTVVLVTPTGTTAWICTVHTIGATTFKVRFFDAAGAAVTSTAVTASWLGKT